MQLADSNVWLALALSKHRFHELASDWINGEGAGGVMFCRSTQQSFLRLLTTATIVAPYGVPPLTNSEAWRLYMQFRDDPRVGFLPEPPGIEERWRELAAREGASPKLWMDAYLAAFAISAGCGLATTDGGFKQFQGLDLLLLTIPAEPHE